MQQTDAKPRIFVVDDEQIIAVTLAAILNQAGFHAVPFHLPHEALEAAQTGQPDLLLTDVVMPKLSGIDLAIQVRALLPLCKVLLFSGMPDTANMLSKSATQGHTFQVLAKPIHPSELIREVVDSIFPQGAN
jgi:DNA-binding NtrC family response regulator